MAEEQRKKTAKIYFRGTKEELERCHAEARARGMRGMDALVRAATELYTELPPDSDDAVRLYAAFLKAARPGKIRQIQDVMRAVIDDARQQAEELTERYAGADPDELEEAARRIREAREIPEALQKLNRRG